MKFLKLKFEHARLIVEKPQSNYLGTNRFFHPINNKHIYNSVCVLFDRTPKPQLRDTNNDYMPLYNDILSVVNEGYIKIENVCEGETNSIVKRPWNSNLKEAIQYTWKDSQYVTGTLYPIFIHHLSNVLKVPEEALKKKAFDDVMLEIQSMGIKNTKGEITYDNDDINNLILWCRTNTSTPLSNYIENKQNNSSRPRGFGKRVHRGSAPSNKYNGLIYIPLNDDLFNELITHTKGFSTILDGGLVTILGYEEIMEYTVNGFTKISDLNSTRKFYEVTSGVKWNNTIYKDLDENNMEKSMNAIIKKCGVSIKENQKEYDNMMKKVPKLKEVKDVAYKLNYFIENSINKQYK